MWALPKLEVYLNDTKNGACVGVYPMTSFPYTTSIVPQHRYTTIDHGFQGIIRESIAVSAGGSVQWFQPINLPHDQCMKTTKTLTYTTYYN